MNWRALYQLAAGACDSTTGLLLMIVPEFTLRLMRVRVMPAETVFLSFIGAFVFGVGLSYLLFRRSQGAFAEALWRITGVVRLCVGSFVAIACVRHQLDPAWATVSVTDLGLGIFQIRAANADWLCDE
jgi:hypothetical protein